MTRVTIIGADGIAQAARAAAKERRDANAWNHNPIEVAANEATAEGLETFASYLETLAEDDTP